MKHLLYIIILTLFSCDSKTNNKANNPYAEKSEKPSLINDSTLTFTYQLNAKNANISNKSDKQVDILYNGIDNFLGEHHPSKLGFSLEFCMTCAPVQKYENGLLFAKRLLIKTDEIKYYRKDIDIADSVNRINVTDFYRNDDSKSKNIQDGVLNVKFLGVSCNDADYNKVIIEYNKGTVKIDSLLNVTFFEYDLNSDGQNEQYIFGSRNCTKELAIIRIHDRKEK